MGFLAPILASPIGSFLFRMVVSYALGKLFQPKAPTANGAAAVMVNKNSNNAPIPVVYGKTRIGGVRAYINSSNGSGDLNGTSHLNIALSLCEGEIGDIKQLWFNDTIVWDTAQGGTIDGSGTLSGFISDYASALNSSVVRFYNGTDAQTVDTDLQNSIGASTWDNNRRFRGKAYIALKLQADAEAYQGGMPLITATLEGKKIANVSTLTEGQTSYGTLYNGADVSAVDVLYDYLTSRRYGKGLDHDINGNYVAGLHVDLDSFTAAKTLADTKFKINGVIDTEQLIYSNIGEILESFNGALSFRAGKYFLRVKNQNETTARVITNDDIVSNVTVSTPEKAQKLNKITAGWRNPASGTDYNDDIIVIENATYLSEDNGSILESRVDYTLVDDETLVTELAQYQMDITRHGMSIQFSGTHTLIVVEAGDIIEMDLPNFGWTNKKFRVMGMELTKENTIDIQAVEYESSIELL